MTPPFVMQIELSPEAQSFIGNLQQFPEKILLALKRGLDRATPIVASRIQAQRLTGQGPFPVEEHMLGQVTGLLRQSVRFTEAVITGDTVTSSIGSNVRYAAVHEFGFDGQVNVRPFFRKHRGRDQFAKIERVAKKTGRRYKATVKIATGVEGVSAHTRHMKIPARAPFRYGIADSDQVITNAITSELETAWKNL
jgi:phage gpG-like protein